MAKDQQRVQSIVAQAHSNRLLPLDALRGLLIVLMALDHANSFNARGKLEPELWADNPVTDQPESRYNGTGIVMERIA